MRLSFRLLYYVVCFWQGVKSRLHDCADGFALLIRS